MKRRGFITLLGGAAVALPLIARAQTFGRTFRIGFLGTTSYAEYQRLVDAFRAGLRQLGYEEGKNIVVEYRWGEGKYERLPALAGELVKLNVDVIVTHSTPGVLAAKQTTSTVPIVMAAVADPVVVGLVPSLARPGGNVTGLSFFWAEIAAKRVQLIKEAVPVLTEVAVFINPATPATPMGVAEMRRTATALGLELTPIELQHRDKITAAIERVGPPPRTGIVMLEEPFFISNAVEIAETALKRKVPLVGFRPQARSGALLVYGVELADLFRRAAAFVDKLLKGAAPADLPIEQAVKFDLVINLKTAKTLGIELPTSLLVRADEVIE
jgi:putative ABC transport system substrate-binding protein